MHILTNSAPIDLGSAGTLKPGRYIVEDVNAFELGAMADRGTVSLDRQDCMDGSLRGDVVLPRFDASRDWNGKRVLFMRSGGLGDMLFLGVPLREMRRRWPMVRLAVACRPERYQVFSGLDYPHAHVQTPVSVEIAASFDAVVSFEHVIENEKALHYVDALAAHMGLTLPDGPESRRIQYKVSTAESFWARFKYPRKDGKKRLGIQVMSGARYRSYPRNQSGEVAMNFLSKGWEVFLFGARGDAGSGGKVEGLRNLTENGLTFRQSVAAMQTCDVVLGPDSALTIVSGALNIPTIALFGPIDSQLRTKYAPSVTAIDGKGVCAKCGFHERGGVSFPRGMSCEKSGRCEVLAGIAVEQIVRAIEEKV